MSKQATRQTIAVFVSSHGWGHAARASAIMSAMEAEQGDLSFELFTRVPLHFFRQVVTSPIGFHDMDTDLGVAQDGPLDTNVAATITALDQFLPYSEESLGRAAGRLRQSGARLAICDITAMGIVAAERAGIPSVLVENFTWDWIYDGLGGPQTELKRHAAYLAALFRQADHHIQTEPVCAPTHCDLTTAPISRPLKQGRDVTRRGLSLPLDAPLVLITMGGIPGPTPFIEQMAAHSPVHFVLAGQSCIDAALPVNVHILPADAHTYHPDLTHACDAVVGKVGYSTLAEVWQAGVPYGYVMRPNFREAEVIARFARENMPSAPFTHREFLSGRWLDSLGRLLSLPRQAAQSANGAEAAAQFISKLL